MVSRISWLMHIQSEEIFTFTHGWYIVDRETGDLYKAYAAADLYYYVEKD